jgi:spore coat protein CotH
VNGQPWGLYTHVETLDRRFLFRWFESEQGPLYEGTYWCDLLSANVPAGAGSTDFCLSSDLSPPGPGGEFTPLLTLTERIARLPRGGFYPEVNGFFDYDRFLTSWAIESVIAHWDGYPFAKQNNYRVYFDPSTSRWTLISTGIDQILSGDQDPWAAHGVLSARCLEESDCERAFRAQLEEVTRVFAEERLDEQAQALRSQLRAEVYADPRKEQTNAQFESAVDAKLRFIRERPARIRQYLR